MAIQRENPLHGTTWSLGPKFTKNIMAMYITTDSKAARIQGEIVVLVLHSCAADYSTTNFMRRFSQLRWVPIASTTLG